nr:MAG TPA: Integrase [Caudoviricetes sp.]
MPAYKDTTRGTWYCSFYYVDWTGEKIHKKKRGFKKKNDAIKWEKDFLNKLLTTTDIPFDKLVENYLDDMKYELKKSTLITKETIINTLILPYFSKLNLNDISVITIKSWQKEIINKGYKATYLKTIHNQLSSIFNYAMRNYGLTINPCTIAGSMGKRKTDKEMEIWTLQEYNKFIKTENMPAYKLAYDILFWTGIREGELLALNIDDFSSNYRLRINKTLLRIHGNDIIQPPKTAKSNREISIPEFLYEEFKEYVGTDSINTSEQLFYFTKGGLIQAFKRNIKRAGVKPIRIHDLRHSHASLLINQGFRIEEISERLGHDSITTTWETYAHLYPNTDDKLAARLNQLRNC